MAVTSVTESEPRRLQRIRILARTAVLVLLAIVLLAALAVLGALAFDRIYAGKVLPGVTVAGVDASGLTAPELAARLEAVPVGPAALEIASGGRSITIPAGELGRRVDIDGAVTAALAAGRASGPLADVPERLALLRDGRAIDLAVSLDRPALEAWVVARAEAIRVPSRSAQIVATPTGWTATTPRYGKLLDVPAAIRSIEAALMDGTATTARVEVPVTVITPHVDRLDTVLAISTAERITAPVTINFRDDASWTIPATTLRAGIRFKDGGDRPVPVIDPAVLSPTLAEISDRIDRPADETLLLKSKSGSLFGFVPGKNGRWVDGPATSQRVVDLMAARAAGTVTSAAATSVALGVIPPDLTEAEAAGIAHEVTLVGAWTTRFFPSERNHNGANIRLPARFINGTVVQPGQVFDFWGAVGPVTFRRGFGMGGIIESGRTNPNGAIGGGICSASTTLFNAAARAGYQILSRDNHSYYITRYPLGLDATVSKYGGRIAQNMRFRNDTGEALFIRGLSGSGWVRFEIYSRPLGRTVTFSSPSVSNVRPAVDTRVDTTELPKGQTERLESPSNGMDVVVTRTVRDANGRVIHSDRWASHYIKVDGILRVGIG
jgi:vancomycin resistance protein YoaR